MWVRLAYMFLWKRNVFSYTHGILKVKWTSVLWSTTCPYIWTQTVRTIRPKGIITFLLMHKRSHLSCRTGNAALLSPSHSCYFVHKIDRKNWLFSDEDSRFTKKHFSKSCLMGSPRRASLTSPWILSNLHVTDRNPGFVTKTT